MAARVGALLGLGPAVAPPGVAPRLERAGLDSRLTTEDRLAIGEVLSLYGYLVDARAYDRLDELFTDDVTYDMTDFDLGVAQGTDEIASMWQSSDQHPVAHHLTNVVITPSGADAASVRCRGLGVGANGRVGSVDYLDEVRRTDEGWRISKRTGWLNRGPD